MRQMKKEIFGYKSFEDLFNQYFEDLMRFVYGYVGNEEVARDIVHDVFLTFWNHREHLDFSWSLKSYLFTLSRNYALNYLRHQKVVAQNEEALMREMESIQDEWEDYDQKIERLQAGLAALPDKQREELIKCLQTVLPKRASNLHCAWDTPPFLCIKLWPAGKTLCRKGGVCR